MTIVDSARGTGFQPVGVRYSLKGCATIFPLHPTPYTLYPVVHEHVIHPGGVDTAMRFDEDRSALMEPQPVANVIPFLLSLEGISTVDEIYVRRESATPWG